MCACACVHSTGILQNELMSGYANVMHTSSSYRTHTLHNTHAHAHTCILKPFEDSEPTGPAKSGYHARARAHTHTHTLSYHLKTANRRG